MARGSDAPPAPRPTRREDPLLVYFTSGTVAEPKMVLHTHASYGAGHDVTARLWQALTPDPLPLAGAGEGLSRLRALGLAYIQFGLAHPDEYRLTFLEGPGLKKMHTPDEVAAGHTGAGTNVFLIIHGELGRLAAAGELRPVDLTVATHTVWFGLHGLVSIFIARPGYLRAERDALIEDLLNSLEQGLRASSS